VFGGKGRCISAGDVEAAQVESTMKQVLLGTLSSRWNNIPKWQETMKRSAGPADDETIAGELRPDPLAMRRKQTKGGGMSNTHPTMKPSE
jgi:hypothetical protein